MSALTIVPVAITIATDDDANCKKRAKSALFLLSGRIFSKNRKKVAQNALKVFAKLFYI